MLFKKYKDIPVAHILYGPFLSGKSRIRAMIMKEICTDTGTVSIDIDQDFIKLYNDEYKHIFNKNHYELDDETLQIFRTMASEKVFKKSDEVLYAAIENHKNVIIECGGNYTSKDCFLLEFIDKIKDVYVVCVYYPIVTIETSVKRKDSRRSQINPDIPTIEKCHYNAPRIFFKEIIKECDIVEMYNNETELQLVYTKENNVHTFYDLMDVKNKDVTDRLKKLMYKHSGL
jgi:hypothetical protein